MVRGRRGGQVKSFQQLAVAGVAPGSSGMVWAGKCVPSMVHTSSLSRSSPSHRSHGCSNNRASSWGSTRAASGSNVTCKVDGPADLRGVARGGLPKQFCRDGPRSRFARAAPPSRKTTEPCEMRSGHQAQKRSNASHVLGAG